ncbi:unnamed protein product [Aphanomyces euteiches]|uniref:Uncharacterized protein n=1 Tax=Aphanomyces euteiches TaxID=100861 RepID=A0A6G0WAW0_9STRA|nr:hypothetical protein Ae201684_016959 [Aphanomyces euteiches]KAH9073852.1 hypothetical protein Ae201684P_003351 [Aphanomyces euteiches]KAH9101800.1 hypothetical protein AeMF1_021505 [Aphanomyces euteiches]KAH9109998.1 hypothetical protein LEN26_013875 [Aphanomyces euteiches]KAH9134269.1 hypothetical protein AeRB84_019899 [Aphanomyces euteiches]
MATTELLACNEAYDSGAMTAELPDDMELVDDMYSSMLAQERRQHVYAPQRHYLKIRLILVDWISDVGDELQLPKAIVHLAVSYLDRLLNVSTPLPPQSKLQLICLVCLMIAAKFGGIDCEVPSMEEIYAYGHQQYSIEDIKACELATLTALEWRLSAVLPINFAEFYLTCESPVYADDELDNRHQVVDPTMYLNLLAKHVDFVSEMVLQEFAFQQWLPSVLATAIICVARRILHISSVWRDELELMSGYVPSDVEGCFHAMWMHYVHHFANSKQNEEEEQSPQSVASYPS